MKKRDKVRCINGSCGLTKGKVYEVYDVDDNIITVNKDSCFWFKKNNFEPVEEQTMKKQLKEGSIMYKIEKIYYKKNGGAEIKFSVINIEKCIMIKEFNKYEDAEAYIYYLLRDKS